jgi:ribose transport system permease protein
MEASLFSVGNPNSGVGYELQIIAAVVVGGTSLMGGKGKVLGTLIGALILAVISNGMYLTKVDSYTQMIVFGALILIAVLLDQLKSKRWKFR